MHKEKSRIENEKRTVAAMIALYCRGQEHNAAADGLCFECRTLLQYAHERLEHCKFGEAKPSCTRCPVHCYKPVMREHICRVMRYSGPRMLLHDPILAVGHLWDFLCAKIGKK